MSQDYLDFIQAPKQSALICWPVEWSDLKKPVPEVPNLHVTCVYLPNVLEIPKQKIIDVVNELEGISRLYRIGDVEGTNAFGPNLDIPVLMIDTQWKECIDWTTDPWVVSTEGSLKYDHDWITKIFIRDNINYETRWSGTKFNPHCTVDLKTVLNPPKHVILRPLELWYMDDEPIAL